MILCSEVVASIIGTLFGYYVDIRHQAGGRREFLPFSVKGKFQGGHHGHGADVGRRVVKVQQLSVHNCTEQRSPGLVCNVLMFQHSHRQPARPRGSSVF